MQIPEYTDEKNEAYKAGYKTITDICIEKVKRAGVKIKKLDTGFKVFKLTHSHFTENFYSPEPEKIEKENIKAFDEYMKQHEQTVLFDFEFKGLLYEIALKNDFNLNFTYEQIKKFDKNKTEKEALICLDEELNKEKFFAEFRTGNSHFEVIVLKRDHDKIRKKVCGKSDEASNGRIRRVGRDGGTKRVDTVF